MEMEFIILSSTEEKIIGYLDGLGVNQMTDPEEKQMDYFQKKRHIKFSWTDSNSNSDSQELELGGRKSFNMLNSPLLKRRSQIIVAEIGRDEQLQV